MSDSNIPEYEVVEIKSFDINNSKPFLWTGIGLSLAGIIIALIPNIFLQMTIIVTGICLILLSLWGILFVFIKRTIADYIMIFMLAILGVIVGIFFCFFSSTILKLAVWIISIYLLMKGMSEIAVWVRLKDFKIALGFIFNGILSVIIAISVWIIGFTNHKLFESLIGYYIAFSFLSSGFLILTSILFNKIAKKKI